MAYLKVSARREGKALADFEVETHIYDRIRVAKMEHVEELCQAVEAFREYICSETLTKELTFVEQIASPLQTIDVIEGKDLAINIKKA